MVVFDSLWLSVKCVLCQILTCPRFSENLFTSNLSLDLLDKTNEKNRTSLRATRVLENLKYVLDFIAVNFSISKEVKKYLIECIQIFSFEPACLQVSLFIFCWKKNLFFTGGETGHDCKTGPSRAGDISGQPGIKILNIWCEKWFKKAQHKTFLCCC